MFLMKTASSSRGTSIEFRKKETMLSCYLYGDLSPPSSHYHPCKMDYRNQILLMNS